MAPPQVSPVESCFSVIMLKCGNIRYNSFNQTGVTVHAPYLPVLLLLQLAAVSHSLSAEGISLC